MKIYSKLHSPAPCRDRSSRQAFSLVEVVVAIGIFAFIIAGIIGLFPILLENQKRTVFENRSMLITQHPHARMQAAANLASIFLNRGYDEKSETAFTLNHIFWDSASETSKPLILGIQADGTSVGAVLADSDWDKDTINPQGEAPVQNITIKAKVSLTKDGVQPPLPGLYRFDCEVTQPANLPYNSRMKSTFSTLVFIPD
jgi:type II secretory pathway pseudopilin PulG